MHPLQYRNIINTALLEDLAQGDVTTQSIFAKEVARADITCREVGVVAGLDVAKEVFSLVDPTLIVHSEFTDGEEIFPESCLMTITGSISSILQAERTALNFLQRMCGIATATRSAVKKVAGTKARIVDTRKTTPGLRVLEKYAVRMGGGENHRFHLGDMVMIKDNHIAGATSITEAVRRVRQYVGFTVKIEVEAASMADVQEALANSVDIIMLDNMTPAQMKAAVGLIDGKSLVEASGGITMKNLAEVAATGIDIVSLGFLTHHNRALDLSLNIQM